MFLYLYVNISVRFARFPFEPIIENLRSKESHGGAGNKHTHRCLRDKNVFCANFPPLVADRIKEEQKT